MRYSIVCEQGGTSWGAYVPDFPGCVAVGAPPDWSMSPKSTSDEPRAAEGTLP